MKTEKRPTEGAYQLRARNKLSQQQRHDSPTGRHRRQQARWSGNGIGATNDSTDYKPLIRIVDGLPVEYTCTDDPRVRDNGTSVSFDLVDLRVLIIQFDYEMATEPGADFDSNLRYLEWSVLWNVAQSIGLHNCNFQAQEALFGERRLQQQPSSPESFVVGLSSLDGDEVDTDTDFCTFLTPEGGAECTPIKGQMTAEYIGDTKIVEQYLRSHIAKEMNSRRVRIEKVEEVRYIGDRGNLQAVSEARTELDSKNSGTNIGLVVGILAGMLVLVIALFLAKGKHRRKQQRRQEAFVQEVDGNLPNSVASVTIAKSDQAVANDEINMADSEDTIETPPDSNSEEVSDEKQTIDPVNVKTTTVLTSTFEPPAEESQNSKQAVETQATIKAHSIPPRPPLSVVPVDESLTKNEKKQEKSKTLATRRKRKKKKKPKQRVLKRVSSKNSINEMETIREDEEDGEEEEGSEEFEYEGSEYSTDDEDEVVVVEPTTQNNDFPGQPKPPSPIQEEPKIKRLPPPWI